MSERRERDRTREWERRLERTVFDNLDEMVAACDDSGAITMINRAMADVVGNVRTPVSAARWSALWNHQRLDGRRVPTQDLPLNRALRGETVRDVEMLVKPIGSPPRTVVVNAANVPGADGRPMGAVVVMHDVTLQREAEAALAFQSLHDPLTGLPNRTLFVDHLRRAVQRAARHRWSTGLIAVNIDGFEAINASLGYDAGDAVLAGVAARLQASTRSSDSVSRQMETVARLGGDEFFILCERVGGVSGATTVAARVASVFHDPIPMGDEAVRVSVRMGITVASGSKPEPEAMIFEAKAALRRARAMGPGSREFFAEEMRAPQVHLDDAEGLRNALERDELRVVFQPKVSLATDRIVGVEALVRWQHPERGLVLPSTFIPLAEETGLIVPMGRWVLQRACEQGARWLRRRTRLPATTVSVNLSARQLEAGLLPTLRAVLADTGMDPTCLCLEVTESMVMGDPEVAAAMLQEIKALGVHLSLDDFGTGYSSLAYLRRFPLTELKIDKSFVDGLGRDPESTAIVAAVMGMAHAMDLSVVAEGVETLLQLEALRALGVDQVQGYYYARPLPADGVDRLMTTGPLNGHLVQSPEAVAAAERGAGTVVVVDDAADVRMLARMSLTAAGFGVHEAESGEGAVDLIRRVLPDCVVLDMHMPGISGLDVCRVLRADPTTSQLTVVMLTADGKAAEKAEAFSLDVDDYIVKPFAPRDLVSRVTAAMRRRVEAPGLIE